MKRAINYIEAIKKYSADKYDDYENKDKLTMRERMANESARDVLEKLVKHLEAMNEEEPKESKADEVKENSNVGANGDGKVPAEAVHGSRTRSAEKVPEVHTGLSKTGSTETSGS